MTDKPSVSREECWYCEGHGFLERLKPLSKVKCLVCDGTGLIESSQPSIVSREKDDIPDAGDKKEHSPGLTKEDEAAVERIEMWNDALSDIGKPPGEDDVAALDHIKSRLAGRKVTRGWVDKFFYQVVLGKTIGSYPQRQVEYDKAIAMLKELGIIVEDKP